MCAFVVLGLVFPYWANGLVCGTSPKWPILCRVGRKTLAKLNSIKQHPCTYRPSLSAVILSYLRKFANGTVWHVVYYWQLSSWILASVTWRNGAGSFFPRSLAVDRDQTRSSEWLVAVSACEFSSVVWHLWFGDRKGKEKERKSIYSAFLHEGTHKALRHGSHSFTCKQHHACLSFVAFTRCHHHSNWGSKHPIAAHYSFVDPERMKGWVGLVDWPIADGLPT